MTTERYRGDTKPIRIQVLSETTGEAVYIGGWTFLLTADSQKNPTNTSTQVFQLEGVIEDAEEGTVEFFPEASDVDLTGSVYYDVQATDSDGKISTVKKDKFKFVQDITK